MLLKKELSLITGHGLTVLVGQLAVMAYGVTDTLVAGRHSQDSLAALSVGSAIFVSVYVALMGIIQALMPIWAEQRGARAHAAIGASVRQSLYLNLGAAVLGLWALLSPAPLLQWTQVPPALQGEVVRYLEVLAWALPAALGFRTYCTLNQALGHPQLVTGLQVGALLIKIPLSIWLTFGGAGLPAQGAVGCAWATLVVNYSLLFLALYLLRRQSLYKPLDLWHWPERPDMRQLAAFLRLGLPAGLAILVEVTSFTLMALFIARQGTLSLAAHQIAANLAAVVYMVPLSLAIAASARVSYWRGAGDETRARHVAWMCFGAATLIGITLAAIVFIAKNEIAALYTDKADVQILATSLLVWVAAYQMADALQTLCVFVLRSYRVTLAPLLTYCALLWGGGLVGGYQWAYGGGGPWQGAAPTPAPFWAASALALTVTALVFTATLAWHLRRIDRMDRMGRVARMPGTGQEGGAIA